MELIRKPKILHIEDNNDIALIVSRILSNISTITRVRNLAEARAKLVEDHYDLALLDLVLPDGSGLDLVNELKQEKPDVAIVIHSAHEVADTISNVDAVMSKMHMQYDDMRETVLELCAQCGSTVPQSGSL